MTTNNQSKKGDKLVRVNTRIFEHQDSFIKSEVKKSQGMLTEGEVTRRLLEEAINSRIVKK